MPKCLIAILCLLPCTAPASAQEQEKPIGEAPEERDADDIFLRGQRVLLGAGDVVLDFGFWSRDERSALRWIAAAVGAGSRVVYLPIGHEEQRRRVTSRFATTPDQTFHMSDVELEQWRAQFEPPDDVELRGQWIPPVPPGYATWSAWAAKRWPSLPDRYAPAGAPPP